MKNGHSGSGDTQRPPCQEGGRVDGFDFLRCRECMQEHGLLHSRDGNETLRDRTTSVPKVVRT